MNIPTEVNIMFMTLAIVTANDPWQHDLELELDGEPPMSCSIEETSDLLTT